LLAPPVFAAVEGLVELLEHPATARIAVARTREEMLLKFFIILLSRQGYPAASAGWINSICPSVRPDFSTQAILHFNYA
jgi:hypothetical protein